MVMVLWALSALGEHRTGTPVDQATRGDEAVRRRAALLLLADRLEVERHRPFGNLASQDEPIVACRAEVDARVDAGVRRLTRCLGEALK